MPVIRLRKRNMRSFTFQILSVICLLTFASAVDARPSHRGLLTPSVCDRSSQPDVSANFISCGGTILLNLRTSEGDNGDYAGGVCERIDGLRFDSLDMDISGDFQDFEIVLSVHDPVTGNQICETTVSNTAVLLGVFSHLHFT